MFSRANWNLHHRIKRLYGLALVSILFCNSIFCVGCGSGKPKFDPDNPGSGNLSALAELCQKYQAIRGGVPKNLEELKQFGLQATSTLKKYDVENVDSLLVSERDDQPFVFLFDNKKKKHEDSPVLIHEAQGADGKRLVATLNGRIFLLDESELAKILK